MAMMVTATPAGLSASVSPYAAAPAIVAPTTVPQPAACALSRPEISTSRDETTRAVSTRITVPVSPGA
jgi:hypothetical protein